MVTLSVGDLLTALIHIPTHIIMVHLHQFEHPCKGYSAEQFLAVFLGTSATILTSFICIDRYFFISRPYHNSGGSSSIGGRRGANQGGSTVKLFAAYCIIAYSIALAMGMTVVYIANGGGTFRAATIFNIVSIVIYTVVLSASLVFNTLLVRYVRKQSNEIKRLSNTRDVVVVQRPYQNRATKTVLLISAIQIFTIIPWVISLAYMTFGFGEDGYVEYIDEIYYMHLWLKMPMFFNSFLNATVFIHRNQHLKKFYRALSSRVRRDMTPQNTDTTSDITPQNTDTTSDIAPQNMTPQNTSHSVVQQQ